MAFSIDLPIPSSELTQDGKPTQAFLELLQQIKDALDDHGAFHGARVYQTAVTALTTTATVMLFGAETFDTSGLHSTSSNTSRLVADTDGYWVATAQLMTESGLLENEFIDLAIQLNGTTRIGEKIELYAPNITFNARLISQVTSGEIFLSEGDYLEVLGQLAPSDNSLASEFSTWFSMRRVGV